MGLLWLTKHDVVLTPCPDLRRFSDDVEQADAAVCFHSMQSMGPILGAAGSSLFHGCIVPPKTMSCIVLCPTLCWICPLQARRLSLLSIVDIYVCSASGLDASKTSYVRLM